MSGECTGPDCARPAARAGLCFGHYRQTLRGTPLRRLAPRSRDRLDRLLRACLDYAEAETDRDYDLATDRICHAALAYARASGDDE